MLTLTQLHKTFSNVTHPQMLAKCVNLEIDSKLEGRGPSEEYGEMCVPREENAWRTYLKPRFADYLHLGDSRRTSLYSPVGRIK